MLAGDIREQRDFKGLDARSFLFSLLALEATLHTFRHVGIDFDLVRTQQRMQRASA